MLRSTTFRSGNPAPRSTPDEAPHHRKTLKPYGNMKNYSAKEIKNIVLIGAPGTGKSFTLNREKDTLLAAGGEYERVTFHPD